MVPLVLGWWQIALLLFLHRSGYLPNLSNQLYNFSRDVATGMYYLASRGFVHRDLAARNILVTAGNTCKVRLLLVAHIGPYKTSLILRPSHYPVLDHFAVCINTASNLKLDGGKAKGQG